MERKCFVLLAQSPVFAEPRAIDDESGTFITRVKADVTHGQAQETAAIFSDHDISNLDAQDRLSQRARNWISWGLALARGALHR